MEQTNLSPEAQAILNPPADNGSGNGEKSVVPPGIAGWGWGPFFWNFIWAIPNRVNIGLLTLIPYVGFVMMFVLGKNGRVWAWKNRKWKSVEDFNRVQRIWSITGLVFFVVTLLVIYWIFNSIKAQFAAVGLDL